MYQWIKILSNEKSFKVVIKIIIIVSLIGENYVSRSYK